MNTPSTSKNIQPPTAPQPLTEKEAYQELDQLNIRINRLEEVVDCCLEDIAECRARLLDLRAQRSDLLTVLLLPWALSVEPPVDETSTPAPPVSLREAIRRSVCAEPATSRVVAERLGIGRTHAASDLSHLCREGKVSYRDGIYGPPGYCDQMVAGRA